jgi:ankyrin repeat protein
MSSEAPKTTKDLLKKVEGQRADETPQTTISVSAVKKVRSFSSYMTNIDQRQKELAQNRKDEEEGLRRTERAKEVESKEHDDLPSEVTGSAHVKQETERLEEVPQKVSTDNFEKGPSLEAHSQFSTLTPLDQLKSPKPEQLQEESTGMDSVGIKPIEADPGERTVGLKSTEIEETGKILPSVPPTKTGPNKSSSDNDILLAENKEEIVGPDEDSAAETDNEDASPVIRPGRSHTPSDVEFSRRVPRLNYEDESDSDYDHISEVKKAKRAKKKKDYGALHSRSRSSSQPRRRTTVTINNRGQTPLHLASLANNIDRVKELIAEGADVNAQDNALHSSLLEAALNGHTEIVRLLLESGASVDLTNIDNDTALIDAAANHHYDAVKVLLEHDANPWLENTSGQTALDAMFAYSQDGEHDEDLKRLLRDACRKYVEKHGNILHPSPNDQPVHSYEGGGRNRSRHPSYRRGSETEFTPLVTGKDAFRTLRERASHGDLQYLNTYLQSNLKNDPETLALAARFGHDEIVSLLLAIRQYDPNAKTNKEHQTALMRAVGRNHLKVVKLLLDNGARVNMRCSEGKNALDYAENGIYINSEEIALLKEYAKGEGDEEPHPKDRPRKSTKVKKRKISVDSDYLDDTHDKKKKKKSVKINDENFPDRHRETFKPRGIANTKQESSDVDSDADVYYSSENEQEYKKKGHTPSVPPETEEQKVDRLKKEEEERAARLKKEQEEGVERLKREEVERTAREKREKEQRVAREKREEVERIARIKREEEEKVARIKREEEEKIAAALREEEERAFAAKREAELALRQQKFLEDQELLKQRKREQLEKLKLQEEEIKRKKEEELEIQKTEELRQKELMSKKGENERRQKIREAYPTGLRNAKFRSTPRSKDEALQYLPLYKTIIDNVEYVTDLQIIMALGIDDFTEKYSGRFSFKSSLTQTQKESIFNFFYPFLGSPVYMSISKRCENRSEELSRFLRLQVYWLSLNDVMQLINDKFSELAPIFTSRTLLIDLDNVKPDPFLKPMNTRQISSAVPLSSADKKRKLPILLRGRPAVVKVLARNKPLWGN